LIVGCKPVAGRLLGLTAMLIHYSNLTDPGS
jgi:hypothetical protein